MYIEAPRQTILAPFRAVMCMGEAIFLHRIRSCLPLAAALVLAGCISYPSAFPSAPQATHRDSIMLKNDHLELEVSPAIGRITGLKRPGGRQLIWLNTAEAVRQGQADRVTNPKVWVNYGGDKAWTSLQDEWPDRWPPDPVIDGAPYTVVEVSKRRLVMESGVGSRDGMTIRRTITLEADAARVRVDNVLTQVEPVETWAHVWSVTQARRPRWVLLDVSPDRQDMPEGFDWILRRDAADHPRIEFDRGLSAVRLFPDTYRDAKPGTVGQWLAAVYDEVVFLQRSAVDPAGYFAERAALEVYSADGFVELETLSNARRLKPGETIEHTVFWELIPVPAGADPAAIDALILDAARRPGSSG